MKIKPEHLEKIKTAMSKTMARPDYNQAKENYKARGLSKKRFAWDVFNWEDIDGMRPCEFSCKELYSYLNDSHIETAILRIVGEY